MLDSSSCAAREKGTNPEDYSLLVGKRHGDSLFPEVGNSHLYLLIHVTLSDAIVRMRYIIYFP